MPRRRPSLSPPGTALCSRRRFLGGTLAAAVPALSPRLGRAQGAGVVSVYNWDTYIGETTLGDFTAATGLEVRYDLYASSDELFVRLREGNPGYDVIFPSNDYVERMKLAGMIQPLDHSKIPNAANIDPAFEDPPFDPGRAYSMPYFWGTVGIGYRRSAAEPTSWADMLASDKYAGRISLLDSVVSIQSVLKYLGHSLNTDDPAQIDEAARVLIEAKPRIMEFAPDTGQDLLIVGEVDLCLEYNGDILQVMEEDDDLAYVVPKEGALLWEDTMCIPTGAPNPDGAHRFIGFILDGKVHGDIAAFIRYPCPNAAAMEHIPEADRANPSIYPPREVLERCEAAVYKGEKVEQMYADAITRVLAAE